MYTGQHLFTVSLIVMLKEAEVNSEVFLLRAPLVDGQCELKNEK